MLVSARELACKAENAEKEARLARAEICNALTCVREAKGMADAQDARVHTLSIEVQRVHESCLEDLRSTTAGLEAGRGEVVRGMARLREDLQGLGGEVQELWRSGAERQSRQQVGEETLNEVSRAVRSLQQHLVEVENSLRKQQMADAGVEEVHSKWQHKLTEELTAELEQHKLTVMAQLRELRAQTSQCSEEALTVARRAELAKESASKQIAKTESDLRQAMCDACCEWKEGLAMVKRLQGAALEQVRAAMEGGLADMSNEAGMLKSAIQEFSQGTHKMSLELDELRSRVQLAASEQRPFRDDVESRLHELQAQAERLQADQTAQRKSIAEAAQATEAPVATMMAKAAELEARFLELEKENQDRAKECRASSAKDIALARAQACDALTYAREAREAVGAENARFHALVMEAQRAREDSSAALQRTTAELEACREEASKKVVEATAELPQLWENLHNLSSEVHKLQQGFAQVAHLRDDVDVLTGEVQELGKGVAVQQRRQQIGEEALDEVSTSMQSLQQQLQLNQQIGEQASERLSQSVRSLQQNLLEINMDLQKQQLTDADAREAYSKLRQELTEFCSAAAELEKRVAIMAADMREVDARAHREEASRENLQNDVESRLQGLVVEAERLRADMLAQEHRFADAQVELAAVAQRVDAQAHREEVSFKKLGDDVGNRLQVLQNQAEQQQADMGNRLQVLQNQAEQPQADMGNRLQVLQNQAEQQQADMGNRLQVLQNQAEQPQADMGNRLQVLQNQAEQQQADMLAQEHRLSVAIAETKEEFRKAIERAKEESRKAVERVEEERRKAVEESERQAAAEKVDKEELERRLALAGAQKGNMTLSLMWGGSCDLDMHVVVPGGEEISYSHKEAGGGVLDVDHTGGADSIENIFWTEAPPPGVYRCFIEKYSAGGLPPEEEMQFCLLLATDSPTALDDCERFIGQKTWSGGCRGVGEASRQFFEWKVL